MNRKKQLVLFSGLAIAAIPMVFFCWLRNDFWESCTTKAYGFPFPWYIDHCLCVKDQPSINLLFCLANLLIWTVAGFCLYCLIERIRKSRTNKTIEASA